MRKLIPFIILLPFFWGCYVSEEEYNKIKEENENLKKEIQAVKTEIDDIKYGPAKLIIEIKKGIENKQWTFAEVKINELIKRHPIASESEEAKKLLATVQEELNNEIVRIENEKAKIEEENKAKREIEAKEKIKKIEHAVKSMHKTTDQVENITWYKDKTSSDKSINSCLYLYFGQIENRIIGPRLYIQYGADDWLFYDKVIFRVDESTIEFTPKEVKRDHSAGKIWEWSDNFVDDDLLCKIKNICAGKKVILRYVGRDYYKDRNISDNEKKAMSRVLEAMNAIKETL